MYEGPTKIEMLSYFQLLATSPLSNHFKNHLLLTVIRKTYYEEQVEFRNHIAVILPNIPRCEFHLLGKQNFPQ